MKRGICIHCGKSFTRHRPDQEYCSEKICQKARKADWQRAKRKNDSEYRADQNQANKDWRAKTPGYWKEYRKKNPQKMMRNRILQQIRNQRRRLQKNEDVVRKKHVNSVASLNTAKLIAKMDVDKVSYHPPSSEFWLVPVIAKMDVIKVNILLISDHRQDSNPPNT